MQLRDAAALDWMAGFTRNVLPDRVAWKQDDVNRSQFYWLAVPEDQKRTGAEIVAQLEGQEVDIVRAVDLDRVVVRLNDRMLDLDRPVTIRQGGTPLFSGPVPRTIATLARTTRASLAPAETLCAEVVVNLPAPVPVEAEAVEPVGGAG
jgi:hypothetical protein